MKCVSTMLILILLGFFSADAQVLLDKKVKIKEPKTIIRFNKKEKTIDVNREFRYEIYTIEGWIVKKGVCSSIVLSNLKNGYYLLWIKVPKQIDSDGDGDHEGIENVDGTFDISNLPPYTYKFYVDWN